MKTLKKNLSLALSLAVVLQTVLPALFVPLAAEANTQSMGVPAIDVVGQYDGTTTASLVPNYTHSGANGGTNRMGLSFNAVTNSGEALDATNHRLFVTDGANNRVLVYNLNNSNVLADKIPDFELGQVDFNTGTSSLVGASSLFAPGAVAWDASRSYLFVNDNGNHRVVIFDLSGGVTTGMAASFVLGQPNLTTGTLNRGTSFSDNACNVGTGVVGPCNFNTPRGISFDSSTKYLYVADTSNNRVMIFDTTSITNGQQAIKELGQPDFTTATANKTNIFNAGCVATGTNSCGMSLPEGVAIDSSGSRLFVADTSNNRVTVFSVASITNGQAMANVLGQATSTTATTGITASTMNNPFALTFDTTHNRLFVADSNNNRVTAFDTSSISNGQSAANVLGQVSLTVNGAGGRINHLSNPRGVFYDSSNDRVYVNDSNYRVAVFDVSTIINGKDMTDLIGAYDGGSGNAYGSTVNYNKGISTTNNTNNGANGWSINGASDFGMVVDSTNHRLFVPDNGNNRVLVFNLDSSDKLLDSYADNVLGQPDLSSNTANATNTFIAGCLSTVNSCGMSAPRGAAYDSGNNRLFVADTSNNRVSVFNLSGGLTNGMAASTFLGQATSTTATSNTTSATMNNPRALAFDSSGSRLFVTDGLNNRVTVFSTSSLSTGQAAANVLGQPDFSTVTANKTNATVPGCVASGTNLCGLNGPTGTAFDASGNRLFVSDLSNNRVMVWSVASITNGQSVANFLGQATSTAATANTSAGFSDSTCNTATRNACGMSAPEGLAYDSTNGRLFVTENSNARVSIFSVASISNGKAASNVLGQSSFSAGGGAITKTGMSAPLAVGYADASSRAYVIDQSGTRMTVYDMSTTITVTSPNGGGSYNGGDHITVNFTSTTSAPGVQYRVLLSTDSGVTFPTTVTTNTTTGFTWTVPNITSTTARIRVQAEDGLNNALAYDDSDADFSITSVSDPQVKSNAMNAIDEIGQYDANRTDRLVPYFTKGGAGAGTNRLGLGSSINANIAIDDVHHRLFYPDLGNNRVLVYRLNSDNTLTDKTPVNMFGQTDWNIVTANTQNAAAGCTTAVNACGINAVRGLAYDAVNNRLFLADQGSNRIMIFDLNGGITNDMAATWVLGQPDLQTTASGTATATTLSTPRGIWYDSGTSRLFVADQGNNRVAVWSLASGITNGMAASGEFGQPDFTHNVADNTIAANGCTTTPNACGMNNPLNVAYDSSSGYLYASALNVDNRVLVFDANVVTNGEAAVHVLGHPDFVTGTANQTNVGNGCTTTINACGMNTPRGLDIDVSGHRLFVNDISARVLVFDIATVTDGEPAVHELGQTSLTATEISGSTASQFSTLHAIAYDSTTQRLYTSEFGNNRIGVFDVSSISDGQAAIDEIGQYNGSSTDFSNTTVTFNKSGVNNGPNRWSFAGTADFMIAMDATHHRLFVSDGSNKRVLVFNLDANNHPLDYIADNVLGQPDFDTNTADTQNAGNGCTTTPNACGMSLPSGLTYDASGDRLFVSDTTDNRVMVFNTATITNGMAAAKVLGQSGFTTSTAATTQSGISAPRGLAYDSANGRLFVAEESNRRVTVFSVASITNGQAAVHELGQPNFTSSTANNTNGTYGCSTTPNACGMSTPAGLDYDATNQRLFVAEQLNQRVTVFDVSSITDGMPASGVLGQGGFTTSTVNNATLPGCSTAINACGMSQPFDVKYDGTHNRLFVIDNNHRVTAFDVATISNGEPAESVIGQASMTTAVSATTQNGLASAWGIMYDTGTNRLYVTDGTNNRVMIFDTSTLTGTQDPTITNEITLSRLKAGSSATISIAFNVTHNLSSTLTVTFPAGFTVTSAATSTSSSACLSSFAFTSLTLTANKSNCAGPITLGGAIVTLPSSPGIYHITWVNDDPGGGSIIVTSEDQVNISASVDPSITFNVGSQASATACDGTYSSNGGTVALGSLTVGSVASSDASSVSHICSNVTTNASSGAVVTVKSDNASLKSVSVPADAIPSSTATVTAGTEGYGLCAGSAAIDSGKDTTTPAGSSPVAASPFSSTCTSSAHNVGALTTSAQAVWSISSASQNAFQRMYLKAAIAGTTKAHSDYTDTLTFVATGTF